jgi:hypothetical protein
MSLIYSWQAHLVGNQNVASRGGRVIAYGCLIKRKEASREHLDYIYRGLMTQHAKVHCDTKAFRHLLLSVL